MMKNTDNGWEKEEFVTRKSKEEFFRDGVWIEQLYELTNRMICQNENLASDALTLCVFNHAYRICWMLVSKKAVIGDIHALVSGGDVVRRYAYTLAYALIRMHEDCYPSMRRARMDFVRSYSLELYKQHYAGFMRGINLSHPIDFRAPMAVEEPTEEVDFLKAKSYVTAALDMAIRQQEENANLHLELDAARVEATQTKNLIKELQEQNTLLKQKVNKLENDELCKVVNLETIAKYGLRQTNSTKVQVIVDMLNRLCVGKGCVPEPLRQKIEELEEHIIALETPRPVTQNNHGCQNFYGNITDSDFHS